jgi:hypothetical protein
LAFYRARNTHRSPIFIADDDLESAFALYQARDVRLAKFTLEDDQVRFPATKGGTAADLGRSLFYVAIERDMGAPWLAATAAAAFLPCPGEERVQLHVTIGAVIHEPIDRFGTDAACAFVAKPACNLLR